MTPGGAWQTVEATTRDYTWAKYDMTTRQRVADGGGVPTTVADFAQAHGGDGPGVYTIGFGCDGTPFSMDVMRVGSQGAVTTYDIEGLRTMVTIAAREQVREGDEVTLTGRLRTDTGTPVPHATMILEKRAPGADRWTRVLVAEVGQGVARATVTPDGPTQYRWRFVSRPLAEGSASIPLLLDVLPPLPTNEPDPTPTPSPSSSPSTPSTPSSTPSSSPASSPADEPTTSSPSPSDSASESVSSSPSGPVTDESTAVVGS